MCVCVCEIFGQSVAGYEGEMWSPMKAVREKCCIYVHVEDKK